MMNDMKLDDFVLLLSTTDQLSEKTFLDELFKSKNQLLEINELNDSEQQLIYSHPFKLDNKYYNADIKFITLNDQKKQLNSNLIDQTEALVIIFDCKKENCLNEIEELFLKFNDDNLQEKVLICRSNNDPDLNNEHVLNWCCKNRFELVDLSEIKDLEDDDGEDQLKILEKIGFNRCVEILDTHSWSTIRFKDEQDDLPNASSDLRSEIKQDNLVDSYFKELTLNENDKSSDFDEKKLTFEELFSQIREFKDKADQLTGDDKYNYAEKVAMAFLNALDEDDE